MYCPTRDDIFRNLLPLLPRGRAWQSDEPPGDVFTTAPVNPPSVLHQFWSAVADVYGFVNSRFCDLKNEFFCATASETLDLWFEEYGLPDDCDPFPNLCAKVAATGGANCAYYQQVAIAAGWSIACDPVVEAICAQFGNAQFGCSNFGGVAGVSSIHIVVTLADSPAFTGLTEAQPLFGIFQFGNTLNCAPDISALMCLFDRIVHAHVAVLYQTI